MAKRNILYFQQGDQKNKAHQLKSLIYVLLLFAPGDFNFFGKNFNTGLDLVWVRNVIHAHALVSVRPWLIQPREKVIAGHH
ncbi:hypothetical protein D1872_315520 [compost metagenome]